MIEPNLCLAREEIDSAKEEFSEEVLVEKILNMFVVPFRLRERLSYEERNSVRHHLFPEVRISTEFKPPVPYQDQFLLSLHDIKTIDLHQEIPAKQIGNKNRLIRETPTANEVGEELIFSLSFMKRNEHESSVSFSFF